MRLSLLVIIICLLPVRLACGLDETEIGTPHQSVVVSAWDGENSGGPLFPVIQEVQPAVLEPCVDLPSVSNANQGPQRFQYGMTASVQFDAIHDFQSLGLSPDSGVIREFITAEIPLPGTPAADRDGRFAFSPNQSVMRAWAETPTSLGRLRGQMQANLAKSETETEFQFYKIWGELGGLKAGFDYTLYFNQMTAPNTLDFEGPNSIPYVRFPQISWTTSLRGSDERSLLIGLEDAPPEFTLPVSRPTVRAENRFPSLIAKCIYSPEWAHVEIAGLYRHLEARGNGYQSDVDGWGVSVSGYFRMWGKDNLILGSQFGQAIGTYSQDTSGFGLDAAPRSATDSQLQAIPAGGLWAAYEHWWTSSTRSNFVYGLWSLDNEFDVTPNPVGTYRRAQYVAVNLIWSPISDVDMGVEYLWGQREVVPATAVAGNVLGIDNRIQVTVRWNFQYGSP